MFLFTRNPHYFTCSTPHTFTCYSRGFRHVTFTNWHVFYTCISRVFVCRVERDFVKVVVKCGSPYMCHKCHSYQGLLIWLMTSAFHCTSHFKTLTCFFTASYSGTSTFPNIPNAFTVGRQCLFSISNTYSK